ncbi:hypothetical protein Tco_0481508 [Tanacetum coccineum]
MFTPDGGIYGLRFDVLKCTGFIPLKNSMREKEAAESVFMDIIVGEGSLIGSLTMLALISLCLLWHWHLGIVATLLTLYRSELTFIALGGVSITLLSKVESHLLLFQKLQKGLVVSGAIHSSWGIVVAGLTLYRAYSIDELTFLALGGVSITLLAILYRKWSNIYRQENPTVTGGGPDGRGGEDERELFKIGEVGVVLFGRGEGGEGGRP